MPMATWSFTTNAILKLFFCALDETTTNLFLCRISENEEIFLGISV